MPEELACPKCGARVDQNDTFCPGCGAGIERPAPAPATSPAAAGETTGGGKGKRKNTVWLLLGCLVAGFLALLLFAILALFFIMRSGGPPS